MTTVTTTSTPPPPYRSLRSIAQALLMIGSAHEKAAAVLDLDAGELSIDTNEIVGEVAGIPGRPERPVLVHPSQLKPRAIGTQEGLASLIHALTHIEANAVNLALDLLWRYAGMPERFYLDWLQVAREEAFHFQLLNRHLSALGCDYGDFPAHDGLWEMAEKTRGDLLARLALVPRTLEAKGLDACPAIKNKLVSIGDRQGADIIDILLRDEIGHVAIGNHWFRHLCALKGLDPISTYADLSVAYGAPKLKGPFNLDARRAAGFDEAELAQLLA